VIRIQRVRLLMASAQRVLADLWTPSGKASVDDLVVVGDSIRGLLAAEVERRLAVLLAADMSVVCVQSRIGSPTTLLVSTPMFPHSWHDIGSMAQPNRRHNRSAQALATALFGDASLNQGHAAAVGETQKLLASFATLGMLPSAPTRASALLMEPLTFLSARSSKRQLEDPSFCDRTVFPADRSMTH